MSTIRVIVFDLGGVLIDWDPRYVYDEHYFDTPGKRDFFFTNICTSDWNEEQDAGRSIVEATQELVTKFPEWENAIRDFYGRWTDMLKGPIAESVSLFQELKATGKYKLYALTNWQAGLFDIALVRYNFLHWFDGRVVSGEEKMRKPHPEFYQLLLNRYSAKPEETLFIDDNLRNVTAARELGMNGIHFHTANQLQHDLRLYGIL